MKKKECWLFDIKVILVVMSFSVSSMYCKDFSKSFNLGKNDFKKEQVSTTSDIVVKKTGLYIPKDRSMYVDMPDDFKEASMPGDKINYTVSVKSIKGSFSDLSIENVENVVFKYLSGDTNGNNIIDEGEEWSYLGEYFITQDDIDRGERISQVFVTAKDITSNVVTKYSGKDYESESKTLVDIPFGAVTKEFYNNGIEDDVEVSQYGGFIKTKYGFKAIGKLISGDGYKNSSVSDYYTVDPEIPPLPVVPKNSYRYKGSPIMLRSSYAFYNADNRTQYFLLTTHALYIFGSYIGSVNRTLFPGYNNSLDITKMDLPEGVMPRDVAEIVPLPMVMFLRTKSGDLYICGDGYRGSIPTYLLAGALYTSVDQKWNRVMDSRDGLPLKNVKMVTGSDRTAFIALEDDTLMTYGTRTLLGDNKGQRNFSSPVVMVSPLKEGETIKQIAYVTQRSNHDEVGVYFVLTKQGKLYSMGIEGYAKGLLGQNDALQLSAVSLNWGVVKKRENSNTAGVEFTDADRIYADSHDVFGDGGLAIVDKSGIGYFLGYFGSSTQYSMFGTAFAIKALDDNDKEFTMKIRTMNIGLRSSVIITQDGKWCTTKNRKTFTIEKPFPGFPEDTYFRCSVVSEVIQGVPNTVRSNRNIYQKIKE